MGSCEIQMTGAEVYASCGGRNLARYRWPQACFSGTYWPSPAKTRSPKKWDVPTLLFQQDEGLAMEAD